MADLQALVYVSTASHLLSPPELQGLLERARARNMREGVTGVLLYADGSFVQYLEGPPAGLDTVFQVIKASPLHRGLIVLVNEPIGQRAFAEWSMGYRATGGWGHLAEAPDTQLAARCAHASTDLTMPAALLVKFWNREPRD